MARELQWLCIEGDVSEGKSHCMAALAESLGRDARIRTFGFLQPSVFTNGQRDGYNLQLLPSGPTIPLARRQAAPIPGEMPFDFYASAFQAAFDAATDAQLTDQPTVILMDEYAGLEAIAEGHYPTMVQWIAKGRTAANTLLVVACNPIRHNIASLFFDANGVTEYPFRSAAPYSPAAIEAVKAVIYKALSTEPE